MEADEMLLMEDFGQKVDLTRRIREVLLNYPEGTTVLKELIQNADDAGATVVRLCLDRRCHGVDSLLSPKLAEWQGPSLLAYNDAVFTEDDFGSISRIGGSKKHAQTWKTGRFGVGFNSVYHLTDLPSFVSGKYVVMFDPQGLYLPNVSTSNPGKRLEFVRSSAISLHRDQFYPYCAFGCDMRSSFEGTLFRFPLRNAAQAARSKLSRQAYVEDDIASMFSQLYGEGVFALLFLKSVLFIEMYEWNTDDSEPRKLYSCSVNSVNDDIVRHRQAILRLSKSVGSSANEMDAFSVEFLREEGCGIHQKKRVETFYIAQMMASASSRIGSFAATISKEYDLHLLPWASVAACISHDPSNDNVGHAFCFLPLPVKTGLNVQVNGYFEVSSNRRGIWYGADMDRSGKVRSIWNRLLLEDVISPSFIQLLLGVKGLLGPGKNYYSLFPVGSFVEPWIILVEHIYLKLSNAPVLYSEFRGGKWLSPAEAYLHDVKFTGSKDLGDALVQLGMPLVILPCELFDSLLKYASGYQQNVVTPNSVRHFLRQCRTLDTLSRSHRLLLLEYCLEDLIDSDVGRHACNLPLVPLANGDFGLLSEASHGVSYFVCNELECMLLEKLSEIVVDRDIPPSILRRLISVAKSSTTNLIVFNIHGFLQLLPRLLPAGWKYEREVLWDLNSNCGHPSPLWIMHLWKYLRDQCEKLSLFDDWPILPSTSGHLCRASGHSRLVRAENLSDELQGLLVKIGCKILDQNYGVEHPDLHNYVSDASAAGVLQSIFDVVSLSGGITQTFHSNLGEKERDVLREFLLDPKWYIGDQMAMSNILNCKKLPIFKVYGGHCGQNFEFSDLENPRKYLPPLNIPLCFLGSEFIIISSKIEEEVLLRYFGVERMGRARFFMQSVFSRLGELQPEERDSIMLLVLHDLPQLCVEDKSFREVLRDLEFVPTINCLVKCPADLYDPRNEELYALLEDSDNFPSGVFQESYILEMLQSLGLKTSVTPETIIQSARHVERLMHEDQEKAHLRGKVLLSYLEVNALKWRPNFSNNDQGTVNRMLSRAATVIRPRNLRSDLEKFWNDLRMICWCPVLVSAPYHTLPWPAVSSMVAPPKLVRLPSDLWLVSASMRILDAECSSTALSSLLGWSSLPGGSMMGSDEMEIVKAVLEGCRWIWVGDGFATSMEVVLNGPLHLAPYIRVIPIDLAVFRDLFLELGIREYLKPTDYADILFRMATRKGSTPLDSQEIRAAMLIVQHLAEAQFDDKQIKIYLPDVSGILFPASDLVYNDAPWLLGSENHDSSSGGVGTVALNARKKVQKFVHGNISNDVAEKLGVCSVRRILLAESADSMNLSLSGAAEAFGQHETLTTRLKHILEMYADGPGILFEMVQNAEDAGASEVIFFLDKTQYGTSSVLSPEMADWQGPALCCFNDSVFSPQDLYAISRIGQESKLEKPFAIGRFGLGFNCVYHFTDIPSFVSGENVVIFDPHASNLPGVSPSHPGLRIKFVGRRMLEQFPDQFSPFLHFGCDLQNLFPGTLFRFPLRSAALASRSHIKKEGYTPEDVISLFSSFSEAVSEALLFLRKVRRISLYVKEGADHEMKLLHRVEKYRVNQYENNPDAHQQLFSMIDGNLQSGLDKNQFLNRLSKCIDRDLPWRCQKVVLTEQRSSDVNSHFWIICECLCGGQVKKNPSSSKKFQSLIPWASVAMYLHSQVERDLTVMPSGDEHLVSPPDIFQVAIASATDRENFLGRAFCFLPLPIFTGFPVHINACFELSSNRRDIWFGNDMLGGGKLRADWNIHLLEDVVAPAYAHLLENVATAVGPCDLFFYYWPKTRVPEPWASVVRKLYLFIADSGLSVLYTKARGGQWISTKHAIFPDFSFHKAPELVEALSHAGLPVVTITKPLVEMFMEVCPSLHILTPQLLRNLLIRRKRGFKDKNAMILTLEYCLFDLHTPVKSDNLYGLPLIPLANGLFAMFNKKDVGEGIYIAHGDEYGLLKDSLPNLLIDCNIPESIHQKLCDIAQREESNISFLTCHVLEKLLTRLLPIEWQHVKQVTWNPDDPSQPSLEWIRLMWSYLRSCCHDLSLFSKWPILPVGNNYLLQLVENSHVIKDDGWSENMASMLVKVGCVFLRRDLPIEHPQLEKYVQSATLTGILNALLVVGDHPENIERLFSDASIGELHELRSFILQTKWFTDGEMNDVHIEIIRHLPIFESFRNRKLVSLSKPSKWLKPVGIHDDLLDDTFVRTESEKERVILGRYLEVKEPSRVEFYKDFLLNHMSEFLSQHGSPCTILQDLKLLIEEDIDTKLVLSETPFVLAVNGSWQKPSRLYDPRVPELQKLLHKEAYFPSEKFCNPETLDTLVSLGLRQTLGFLGLLDCARTISILHDSGDPVTLSYGRRLLSCLDVLASKLSAQQPNENCEEFDNTLLSKRSISCSDDEKSVCSPSEGQNDFGDELDINLLLGHLDDLAEETFWHELKAIAWCPVYTGPPLRGLPWLKTHNQVAAPIIVRPKSQMLMVSASMHILDGDCNSPYLQRMLGWMDCPTIDVLSTQLLEVSRSYANLKSHSAVEPDFVAAVDKGIPLLYSKLQEYIDTDDLGTLRSALDVISWVWIGDDFVSSNALAFDSPVKFVPYLYVVPSELSDFKDLLLALGVRISFDLLDYFNVLQRLQSDVKGLPLTTDQLGFVHCVLEAIADCSADKPFSEVSSFVLLIPDSSGVLTSSESLVYNDAPWMEGRILSGKNFVHPSISNDLSNRLGIKSLRCLSLVNEEMTKDMPCMDYAKISELRGLYGEDEFLLFDLLELADCCKAKKLHLIIDRREHPCQSLLQHNLGEFQGPAVVAILEGAILSMDEVRSLQFLPPWRLWGDTVNYGLGLLSCYSLCDLLSVLSGGYFYMFDPRGLALGAPSSHGPVAKMFTLTGTNLAEQFSDQFNPMLIGQNLPWVSADSTIIRMPLSSECMKDGLELGMMRVKQIFDRFIEHGSRTLLYLKSVFKVSLSTWEERSLKPREDYSVFVDPSCAIMRNPFSEKKWRKFQISRLFSSSNAATKLHLIDVNIWQGGTRIVDKWLIVLSLGSGQTRNMALDRRYLAYNLTPVAGIAAHISRNDLPVDVCLSTSIMSPLPLSGSIYVPVTIIGCFLVRHNCGRFLFKYQEALASGRVQLDAGNQLMEAWNHELMSCVCDSYVEVMLEIQKLWKDPSSSKIESTAALAVKDQFYSFWPKSNHHASVKQPDNGSVITSVNIVKADWECIVDQVIRPFYSRLAELPVWQLYSGNLVKANEGMFLSQPGNRVGDNLLPATVCGFVKEHYPVFSVPWDLVTEIQAVGAIVREIKPKMVRDLLKMSSASIVLQSVDTFVDVLDYCLSDIQLFETLNMSEVDIGPDMNTISIIRGSTGEGGTMVSISSQNMQKHHALSAQSPSGSGGDALEMMTNLGKVLFDFGRGVVEDIGRSGGPLVQRASSISGISHISSNRSVDRRILSVAAELKGLPCPTAAKHLSRLGAAPLWIGNTDQQALMTPFAAKFIHPKLLERSTLADIFSNINLQQVLKLESFSFQLLASHVRVLFHENWVNHVMQSNLAPWFSWENSVTSGAEGGPSPEWISGSEDDLSLFSEWPLIPAFLGRQILCRVRELHVVFVPPLLSTPTSERTIVERNATESDLNEISLATTSEVQVIQSYISAFEVTKHAYPWLFSLLNQCNIPIFDTMYMDCARQCNCFPAPGESLGHAIVSKLVAANNAGYFPAITSFPASDCDQLFNLFANDFSLNGSKYGRAELDALRALPIYKTIVGSYKKLQGQDLCIVSSTSFFKPYDERCLSYSKDSIEGILLLALGVPELHDQQILVKFALPGYQCKSQPEQEDILIYVLTNWQDLQVDTSVIEALKETQFVRNADEYSTDLSKPKDLFDPGDALLTTVFSGQRKRFPGERFIQEEWVRILRKTGLRNATDAEVMLECCRRVEFLGKESMKPMGDLDDFENAFNNSQNEVPWEIWSLAESLIAAIFANFAVLYGNNFCNVFGKIACVPAEKGFPSVGGKKGGKRVLSSYSEVILLKDWPLAWTCAPILSRHSIVPPEYSWGALHLRSPPAFKTVLRHLQAVGRNGGEDTLAHWPTTSGLISIDEASCEVLKYLDKVWGSLSSSDIAELQNVAFIPAANGTRLVKANSLFARLSINLSPFAFELPAHYLPFVKILKDLGLQDMLSVGCAKELLLNLQKACGYQHLNPNELRAVMEILYFVCDGNVEAKMSDESNWESEAIVPDDGCRLVHAKSCVYLDAYGSRFVKFIDVSRVRFVHPDIPERICSALGIRKFSDIVVEELHNETDLLTLGHIGSVSLASIREKLLSRSFQRAVWVVFNSLCNSIPAMKRLALENVERTLESIAEKLQFVQCIYTRFLLLPKSLDITRVTKESTFPEWEQQAQHRTLYFLNRPKTCILVAEPPSCISVLDVISIVVSQVLGSSNPLPIGCLFLCPNESETATVELLNLCSEKREMKSRGEIGSLLGKEILPQDALQVQFHPLRPFYAGEIVAWRSQNGDKLKYGRVVDDVRPSQGQALYRFMVETLADSSEQLLSSQVFSFKSVLMGNSASSTEYLGGGDTLSKGRKNVDIPENSDRGATRTQQLQPSKEVKYGRVTAGELVQAVHEMLSAAGINFDMEKQSLVQTTLSLQEQLKDSQAALLLEQERADMAAKEADTAKTAWQCRVCLAAEVDVTVVPCGHVLCRRCSCAVSRCPFCRLQVSKTMRIFRP
ncbi:hypothetical protein RJ641_003664 [Dillenia turbinata]|uniref:RING-type domain-containing protein n=1 Tax=Dillenia turbinata TaxID=194707 RepID=A0AAN8VLD5_9MAGN